MKRASEVAHDWNRSAQRSWREQLENPDPRILAFVERHAPEISAELDRKQSLVRLYREP